MDVDTQFMRQALDHAKAAAQAGEVPVGALLVKDGQVISSAGNEREALKSPLAHAEITVISRASQALDRWRLTDCTLYVTLEPCTMCAGAIVQARLARVVYGARDPKAGAVESLYRVLSDSRLNHRPEVLGGVLAEECGQILSRFFASRRG
ncbi:MAG: tRNA adenosine(34) deaminase TadA [Bdellovibrionales bacterium]